MSAVRPFMRRICCKTRFALVLKNSKGCQRDFHVKMRGASSPHGKLIGDFRNAIEVTRIGDCFSLRIFRENSQSCNFRLLQHNRGAWYSRTRNFAAYGHPENEKTQKFVFRAALRPNQISFSHSQDPKATFRPANLALSSHPASSTMLD
jgi:hypothetical protein